MQQTSGRIWKYTFEDLMRNCWKGFLTLSEAEEEEEDEEEEEEEADDDNNNNNKYFPFTRRLNSITVDYKENRSQEITPINRVKRKAREKRRRKKTFNLI